MKRIAPGFIFLPEIDLSLQRMFLHHLQIYWASAARLRTLHVHNFPIKCVIAISNDCNSVNGAKKQRRLRRKK